jgi:hypothetical protein
MPDVSAPESAGTVIAYTTINGSNSHGDLSARTPINNATKGVRLCRPSGLVLDLLEHPLDSLVKEDGDVGSAKS